MLVDPPTAEGVVSGAATAAAAARTSGKAGEEGEEQSGMAEEGLEDAAQAIGTTGFTQLTSCKPVSKDLYPEFGFGAAGSGPQQLGAREWVGQCLRERNQATGGRIEGFARERIEGYEVKSGILGLMGSA